MPERPTLCLRNPIRELRYPSPRMIDQEVRAARRTPVDDVPALFLCAAEGFFDEHYARISGGSPSRKFYVSLVRAGDTDNINIGRSKHFRRFYVDRDAKPAKL